MSVVQTGFTTFAVTPEKLCQTEFIELLDTVHENNNLNRLVVDEVGRMFNSNVSNCHQNCIRPIAYR